jgi:hypothetical protein
MIAVSKFRSDRMKEIRIGNTVGIIHSPLMDLSKEDRRKHFENELANGNPILKELERIINESYWKRMQNKKDNNLLSN